jgi:thymidylate synthase
MISIAAFTLLVSPFVILAVFLILNPKGVVKIRTKEELYKWDELEKQRKQQEAEKERIRKDYSKKVREYEKRAQQQHEKDIKESLLSELEKKARSGDVEAFRQWKSLQTSTSTQYDTSKFNSYYEYVCWKADQENKAP